MVLLIIYALIYIGIPDYILLCNVMYYVTINFSSLSYVSCHESSALVSLTSQLLVLMLFKLSFLRKYSFHVMLFKVYNVRTLTVFMAKTQNIFKSVNLIPQLLE